MPVIVLHLQKHDTHTHSAPREHEIKHVHDSLNISKIFFFIAVCLFASFFLTHVLVTLLNVATDREKN